MCQLTTYTELKVYITNLLREKLSVWIHHRSRPTALQKYSNALRLFKQIFKRPLSGCFLQEASLRSWRSTTTSQGRRLTWPSEKATSCRLSTTRKSPKPSASSSSSASPSDAAASQRWASEQIFQVARGRGRVQTQWLMSAAGVGDSDSDSESDPLHLLAAAERDDTPLLHPFPVVVIVSKTATEICFPTGWLAWKLCCGCCGVWTGTGWASFEMSSAKIKVSGEWGVPNRILLLFWVPIAQSVSKMKKYTNCTEL